MCFGEYHTKGMKAEILSYYHEVNFKHKRTDIQIKQYIKYKQSRNYALLINNALKQGERVLFLKIKNKRKCYKSSSQLGQCNLFCIL